tara:strand:- start:26 stop:925 length:900 start_codon:yes stop_codon:yes gene_type:complete
MASSYTDNSGIELIGVGEQSGTWGTTTNNNLEIIDKALNGVSDVAVTGAMNITVTDGDKTSNGHTRVLKLTNGGGGASTLTIHPDDREAFYIVHNGSGSTVTFKQRSANTGVAVPDGAKAFIYADGKGSSNADVFDLLSDISTGGTKVTQAELALLTGGSTIGTTAVAAGDGILTNDGGTMRQTTAATFSTYFNSNLVEVKSPLALTSSPSDPIAATGATSVYQRVTSDGAHTLKIAITNLAIGQYVIIDKTTSANSVTLDWTNGGSVTSNGITLGSSVEFALGIYNGTGFSFTETVKF